MTTIYNYHKEGKYCEISFLIRSSEYKIVLKDQSKNNIVPKSAVVKANTLKALINKLEDYEVVCRNSTTTNIFPIKFFSTIHEKITEICSK